MNYASNPVAGEQSPSAIFHCEITGENTFGDRKHATARKVPSTSAQWAADSTTNVSTGARNQDEPFIEV